MKFVVVSAGSGILLLWILWEPKGSPEKAAPLSGFQIGINYPWRVYAGDFGGIKKWQTPGVAGSLAKHRRDFKRLAGAGVEIIRWWIFPDLRGDGLVYDPQTKKVRLAGTWRTDLTGALELLAEFNLKVVFTVFSFEAFKPRHINGGIRVDNLGELLQNPATSNSIYKAVADFVKAATEADKAGVVYAWDLINEPEWSVKGQYRDRQGKAITFYPLKQTDPVTYDFMLGFLQTLAGAVRRNSPAKLTVGSVSLYFLDAWLSLRPDFLQVHSYDWTEKKSPLVEVHHYERKIPVVIGEFDLQGTQAEMEYFWKAFGGGYSGLWGWSWQTKGGRQRILASIRRMAGIKKAFSEEGSD